MRSGMDDDDGNGQKRGSGIVSRNVVGRYVNEIRCPSIPKCMMAIREVRGAKIMENRWERG